MFPYIGSQNISGGMIYTLNCSNNTYCHYIGIESTQAYITVYYSLLLALSSIGYVTNLMVSLYSAHANLFFMLPVLLFVV